MKLAIKKLWKNLTFTKKLYYNGYNNSDRDISIRVGWHLNNPKFRWDVKAHGLAGNHLTWNSVSKGLQIGGQSTNQS